MMSLASLASIVTHTASSQRTQKRTILQSIIVQKTNKQTKGEKRTLRKRTIRDTESLRGTAQPGSRSVNTEPQMSTSRVVITRGNSHF